MKKWLPFVVLLTWSVPSPTYAQSLDDTPLASCPGYVAGHRIVSQLNWSASCFLHAIHTKNRALLAALVPGSGCERPDSQYCVAGTIETEAEQHAFGPGRSNHTRPIYDLVIHAKTILIVYRQHADVVMVRFIPRPGKRKVDANKGWMKDYFECEFDFDKERRVWVLNEFCDIYGESHYGDYDEKTGKYTNVPMIDLTGEDSALPPMVWKPSRN